MSREGSQVKTCLSHDEAWMDGGLQAASQILPAFEWGSMDPNRDVEPIHGATRKSDPGCNQQRMR